MTALATQSLLSFYMRESEAAYLPHVLLSTNTIVVQAGIN